MKIVNWLKKVFKKEEEKFLVIDTETANTIEQPLCYDIGYAICDRKGKIYEERSFVVAEMFIDHKDLMKSAYYKEKIPQYWEDIKNETRVMKSIFNIRKQMIADIKKYKIKKIGAYNMVFDKRALNTTFRYLTQSKYRWFFPFGVEMFCIWNMACQTLMNSASYVNFAKRNDLVSESGNLLTSAESCYKFLTRQIDFVEKHTGLEDVKIEVEIMSKCLTLNKEMSTAISPSCWRIPQRKKKEMELTETFKKK